MKDNDDVDDDKQWHHDDCKLTSRPGAFCLPLSLVVVLADGSFVQHLFIVRHNEVDQCGRDNSRAVVDKNASSLD